MCMNVVKVFFHAEKRSALHFYVRVLAGLSPAFSCQRVFIFLVHRIFLFHTTLIANLYFKTVIFTLWCTTPGVLGRFLCVPQAFYLCSGTGQYNFDIFIAFFSSSSLCTVGADIISSFN